MKIYVLTNVLCSYTSGMIVVAARNPDEALAVARAEHPTMSDYTRGMPCVEEFTLSRKARVLAHIYGGG